MESHDGKTNDKSFSGPEGNRKDSPGEVSQAVRISNQSRRFQTESSQPTV